MQRLHTDLTDLLDIDSPVVLPAMTFASGGRLAAEVTLAGGFGFAAPGFVDGATFARELDVARDILSTPLDAPLPIGTGYLAWMLDKRSQSVDTLRVALEQRVKCIWLSFGNDFGRWVDYIRKYDQNRKVPHRTLIWIVVNSVAEAERATNQWKADILVVQGIEAGGHGHSQALPLITLLPLIKQSLPNSPPLVAAGGLANGAQVAALLVLGASGGVLGTRFLATPESTYTSNQKDAVLAATSSVRTYVFDNVRGTVGWPEGVDGRALPNKTLEDEANGIPFEERKKVFMEATVNDDTSRTAVWAGASVALVKEITSAGNLVRTIHLEIMAHLSHASAILGGN